MGKLEDLPGAFTGTIGNLIYYRRYDMKGIFVRKKGGISKKRISSDPQFARTRENYTEFSGCIRASGIIRNAIYPVCRLADYNFTPALRSLMRKVQVQSDKEERGQRSIFISKHRHLLENFQLNRNQPFMSVLRHPLSITFNRERSTAHIDVPALVPEVNLFLPWQSPYYRLVLVLAAIPDQVYDGQNFRTTPDIRGIQYESLPWQLASQSAEAQTISLQLAKKTTPASTLIVSAGIEMGTPGGIRQIDPVPRQGTAMILRLG